MTRSALLLSVTIAMALLIGCQSTPKMTGEIDPITGLHLVDNSPFDKLALESPQKLNKYQAIYFAPLNLNELTIDTRRLSAGNRDWALSDTEKSKIAGFFADSIVSSFRSSSVALARTPGEKVLTAEISLVSFTPTATKDDSSSRTAFTEVFTYNVGTLEMTGHIKDSITGEVVGFIEDSQEVGDTLTLERNDRVNNARKLKNTFDKWTQGIATAFSEL